MANSARKPGSKDMSKRMADDSGRQTPGRSGAGTKGFLTPADFAKRFESVSRTLWCIAAAVVGDRSAADDVLQESAMIALGKLNQFDPDTNFLAWMARIVRFVALNHGRRRQASSAAVDPQSLEGMPDRRAAIPQHVQSHALNGRGELTEDQDTFDDHVLNALSGLEHNARACLLLRVVLDMPYREIARALDMAEGTAMSHVHRARAALRETLMPHFFPHVSKHAHGEGDRSMKAGGRHD
jgi:RNA polymerase sigma-70 factor (ECF subfamily)